MRTTIVAIFNKSFFTNYFRWTESNDLKWVLLICGIFRILFYINLSNTDGWFPDTVSYIDYPYNILKGTVDDLRTPVYPYFIKLMAILGESNLFLHIKVAQSIISFISIIIFYSISKSVFLSRGARLVSTLTFGLNPSLINQDFCVLTESLSISLSVLFLWIVVNFNKNPNVINSIFLSSYTIFLIMLRPSFLFIIAAVLIFWIFRLILIKKELHANVSGITSSLVVIAILIYYGELNHSNNRCRSISSASTITQFVNLSNYGLLNYECDKEIYSEIINKNIDKLNIINFIFESYSIDRISKVISCSIFKNLHLYVKNVWNKTISLGNESTTTILALNKRGLGGIPDFFSNLLSIRFFTLYLLIIIDFLYIFFIAYKNRTILWIKLFIWMFISGQLLTTLIGGFSEYQRLFSIALPFVVILFFSYVDIIIFSHDKQKTKEYVNLLIMNSKHSKL